MTGSDLTLTMGGSVRLGLVGPRRYGRTTLTAGESAFVALSWADDVPTELDEAFEHLGRTESFWRGWMSTADFPDHRYRPYIERSALALKGLSYAPTGAIMAAATTSLPETPGGERNWDYRYTWIRDTAFMLRALHGLGFNWEAFEYFAFILDAVGTSDPDVPWDLQIMYGIAGERDLTEHSLDHLSGYRGSRPVRTGNGAFDQHQHDVWGMLLDAVEEHLRGGGQIAPVVWSNWPASSTRRSGAARSRTRASGRCAASRSTSWRRRSCAGSRPTAGCAWRACAATPSGSIVGRPPRRS